MKTITLCAASLVAALALAAGNAAAARDQPNNRGYVVGKGGVARLADGTQVPAEAAAPDETVQADAASGRLMTKNKSRPPVVGPIGVNEPGVNRTAPAAGGDAALASNAATARAPSPGHDSQTDGEAAMDRPSDRIVPDVRGGE